MTGVEAGWYADPLGRAQLRWYDGAQWCEHVRSGQSGGTDPLAPDGTPVRTAPDWARPQGAAGAGAVPSPGPADYPGLGRGTKLALGAVAAALIVLGVVGAAAVLTLVRGSGGLTTAGIETQVARALGLRWHTTVTVHCPPVIYLDSSGGTIQCTATDLANGRAARVQVLIKDAKLAGWSVLGPAQQSASVPPMSRQGTPTG
jgi:hypothetical protein